MIRKFKNCFHVDSLHFKSGTNSAVFLIWLWGYSAQKILLRKDGIDLLVKLQPDLKLAPNSWIFIHDPFEFFRVGEDHGGIFAVIIAKTSLAVRIHKAFFIVIIRTD